MIQKRSYPVIALMFLLTILLAACSNDSNNNVDQQTNNDNNIVNNETNDMNDNQNTSNLEEASSQDDMKEMVQALSFEEIEIEVEYDNNLVFEAEIDHHQNGDIDAEIEDEINGIDIDDDIEAFNYLYPYMKQLDISQDSDRDDVINQVLDVFELDKDYKQIEIEVSFEDGVEIEFEDQ